MDTKTVIGQTQPQTEIFKGPQILEGPRRRSIWIPSRSVESWTVINFVRIHFKYLQLIQNSEPMTSAVHQGHLMRPVKTSNLDLNSLW